MFKNWVIEGGMANGDCERLTASAQVGGKNSVYNPAFLPFGVGLTGETLLHKRIELPSPVGNVRHIVPVVFHGSIQGCKYVRENTDWIVYAESEKYFCSYYYPRLKEFLWNDRPKFLPWGMIVDTRIETFRDLLRGRDAVFVRPDSPDKMFTGQVLYRDTVEEQIFKMQTYNEELKPETMCVVHSPLTCHHEMRFIVGGGKVITGSYYIKDRKEFYKEIVNSDDEWGVATQMYENCREKGYDPEDIWVLDLVSSLDKQDWYIMECGNFSGAGLYQCNTDKIVEHVHST